jgi:[acyl-carrier-protein] S-malonyltransferase
MGISVKNAFPEASDLFDRASAVCGYDMSALCAEEPAEKLADTRFTQPALYTVESAITTVLKSRRVTPDVVAGHSLGEITAWFAAGVYGFEDGLKLVMERGRLMAGADPDGVGTMAAVIGMSAEQVNEVCAGFDGRVVVANDNSPQQQVISGEKNAVAKASAILSEKGAKRILPLKVSGAFHSPLMAAAKAEFARAVDSTPIGDARIPVFANLSASPVTQAEEIRSCMVEQLTSPVRWTGTIRAIAGAAASRGIAESEIEILEIGPGTVLAGLVKRIAPELTVHSIQDREGIINCSN